MRANQPQPGRDASGKYRQKCRQLATDLGFKHETVWYWFEQFACVREQHSPFPARRTVAEDGAYRDVLAVFDKRGEKGN